MSISKLLAVGLAVGLVVVAGTRAQQIVRDVAVGPAGSALPNTFLYPSPDGEFALVPLDDGVHGRELWRTDGTSAGTFLVKDLVPGPQSGSIGLIATVGLSQWFTVVTPPTGTNTVELWRTDGTASGTVRVLVAGPSQNITTPFTSIDGDLLLFVQNSGGLWELWRTDPSFSNPTTLWTDSNTRSSVFGYPFGDEARYFTDGGGVLWRTDGTVAGTASGITPNTVLSGAALGGYLTISYPRFFGSRVTIAVIDGRATTVATFDSRLIRVIGCEDHVFIFDNEVLYRWDGLSAPQRIATFSNVGQPISMIFKLDDRILFPADDGRGHGTELWVSDATAAGTRMLRDFSPGPASSNFGNILTVRDRAIVWVETPGRGFEPWGSDGTPAGTTFIGDLGRGTASSFLRGATFTGERHALLGIDDSFTGAEPWITDGFTFRRLNEIRPGGRSSIATDPFAGFMGTLVAGRAVFFADDGTRGRELWTIDTPGNAMWHGIPCRSHPTFGTSDPVLGANLELRTDRHEPGQRGLILVGLPAGSNALEFGGCVLHVDPRSAVTAAVAQPDPSGAWRGTIAIPNQPSLLGVALEAQGLFAPSTAVLGWHPGAGIRLTLGR